MLNRIVLFLGCLFFLLFSTASAMVVVNSPAPFRSMMATCRFEDSLVVISETIDKLTIQLTDYSRRSFNLGQRNSFSTVRSLNASYRTQVTTLANVSQDENPIPVLQRIRRDIKQTLDSIIARDAAIGSTDSSLASAAITTPVAAQNEDEQWLQLSKKHMMLVLPAKWRNMILSCLEQYRILQRVILFENWLEQQLCAIRVADGNDDFDYFDAEEGNNAFYNFLRSTFDSHRNWLYVIAFKLKHVAEILVKMVEHVYGNHLFLVFSFAFIIFFVATFTFVKRQRQQRQRFITGTAFKM